MITRLESQGHSYRTIGAHGRLPAEFRDRTKRYAADVIRLFIKMPKRNEEVRIVGKQLLRSGTSVAAHVREAARARSQAEFA